MGDRATNALLISTLNSILGILHAVSNKAADYCHQGFCYCNQWMFGVGGDRVGGYLCIGFVNDRLVSEINHDIQRGGGGVDGGGEGVR